MLKIYLKTIHHEIHSDGAEYKVKHYSFYTIEDEAVATPYTIEHNLYSDMLHSVASYCDVVERKKGLLVYVYGSDCFLKFKQWKEPNAKLIERVSYREHSCSMNELCRLPESKVIAYLKQEGVIFTLTN